AEGLIKPTDLVRRSGSKRWLKAARVEGLFCAPAPEWYYIHDRERVGPVTLGRLRRRARSGRIQSDDLVWKPGLREWKRAAEVGGRSGRDRLAAMRGGGGSSGPRKDSGHRGSVHRLWLLAPVFPVLLATWIGLGGRESAPRLEPAPAPIGTAVGAIAL